VALVGSLSTSGGAEDEAAGAEGGRVEYNGTANAKMEFCFGRTVSSLKESVTIFNGMTGMNRRLSWFLLVTTLKAFSVSWMTIPDRPIRHGFLLCLTVDKMNRK
jgi:hypothetical protein